ncbi:MAG: FadR family transcriptional regulator [Spirochaetales bacterium]|nr:FadR family transcriptional regulator [Spirochaetales bacterium]
MEVKPIVKKRVYQEIINQFVEMLREDRIKVGEKLPAERALADMFQVSRPSVREALRVMETIGLIETRAGGGAFVTDLNLAPFINTFAPLITRREGSELELLDLRELLEVKAVGLTAESAGPEAILSMEEIIQRMYQAIEIKDADEGARCDIEFHRMIFESSGNYVLMQTAHYVNSLMEISIKGNRAILLRDEHNAVKLCSEHQAIFEAIRQKDPVLARKHMTEHIERVRILYQETLQ